MLTEVYYLLPKVEALSITSKRRSTDGKGDSVIPSQRRNRVGSGGEADLHDWFILFNKGTLWYNIDRFDSCSFMWSTLIDCWPQYCFQLRSLTSCLMGVCLFLRSFSLLIHDLRIVVLYQNGELSNEKNVCQTWGRQSEGFVQLRSSSSL